MNFYLATESLSVTVKVDKVFFGSVVMSRYHQRNIFPVNYNNISQPGDARRGVIPLPETPAEKIDRLQKKGYFVRPVESAPEEQTSSFEQYDFGNKELPAYRHKREMIDTVDENRISMLVGPTGSGKTTQLGQFALERGYRVVYLVPRRVIVDNVGERIEEELGSVLGEEKARSLVGLAHSERNSVRDESLVQVMTSGTFTKKLPDLAKQWEGQRVLVVADEIHEGNLETEFASALAVKQVERDDAWRIVFASATPDNSTLTKTYEAVNGAEVPVVTIEGRPHELDIIEEPTKDIVEAYHEHSAGVQKSLIFVEGKREINKTISELKKSMSADELEYTKFFKLHANISDRARMAIFDMNLQPGEKAIVVSTSAGQSGITIPGVGLVVTNGITKSPELDEEGAPGLPARLCTQAEIVQQGGRAGRDIAGGKCVLARPIGYASRRNWDNELFKVHPLETRSPHIPPEIYHSNISRNILAATAMGQDFFELNDYLQHSVSQGTIHEAYELLHNLGAVDDDNKITDLGAVMDIFPLRPELSRAAAEIIHSKSLPIQVYTLAIASAIEAGGLADFDSGNSWWKQILRPTTDDDFIAQLDMMLASREFYGYRPVRALKRDCWGDPNLGSEDGDFVSPNVDEEALAQMGLSFKNVYRAHRQLDKMCKLIGLNSRDVSLSSPTESEEHELRNIFLAGMPELLYKKVRTERRKGKYENVWGYDSAITREISSRSMLSMGQQAVKIVAGYPRWYVDSNQERHDIIDFGFPTSIEQVKAVLGHLATRELDTTVRGGYLVKSGKRSIGSLPIGSVNAFRAKADSPEDQEQLVEHILLSQTTAVSTLRELGVDESTIATACRRAAYGATSVDEIDTKLWGLVAEFQTKRQLS